MALPQLSSEQRQKNLELAAQIRQTRAKIRVDLKSGELALTDILKRCDEPAIKRMKVSSLIEALPGYGKARAEKLMDEAGISMKRRIQGLGVRQREALLKALAK